LFERGFKTWCEKYAVDCRAALGVASHAPLDMRQLAAHLDLRVWTPHDVPALSGASLNVLLRNDGETPSCWSAVTLVVGEKAVVILNSSHSPARQASDLAHELAHRILGHSTEQINVTEEGLMLLGSYAREYEEEADWLAGCLLLPREALLRIKRSSQSETDAAIEYGVSRQMLAYRMSRTGVAKQYARIA